MRRFGSNGLRIEASNGFSLLETLISTVFLTIVAVTILQCMAYCFRISEQAREVWCESLARWNEIQDLRSGVRSITGAVMILPEARPMFYQEVSPEPEAGRKKWGVLLSGK